MKGLEKSGGGWVGDEVGVRLIRDKVLKEGGTDLRLSQAVVKRLLFFCLE